MEAALRAFFWIAGTLTALAAAVIFGLPVAANSDWARQRIADAARDAAGQELAFGEVTLSPLSLSVSVRDRKSVV